MTTTTQLFTTSQACPRLSSMMVPLNIIQNNNTWSTTSTEMFSQWTNPGDVFSVLLILGGDVVAGALAQLAGGRLSPVTFSFGWVAYSVAAVVSAFGENKLMPVPDCRCIVINGKNGYIRENSSWIIGRIVRDFEFWMDPNTKELRQKLINDKWNYNRESARKRDPGSESLVPEPNIAGLCVSIYKAKLARPRHVTRDPIYYSGFVVMIIQLGVAAIPYGLDGDWGILLITACGILLSMAMGSVSQWAVEKWPCRVNTDETFVLTRGNGSQHAIVIIGDHKGLNLEDLASAPANLDVSVSMTTRIIIILFAVIWVLLLITAAGLKENTWYLLAVGGVGMLQNIMVAGWRRRPSAFGLPLKFEEAIGNHKVMQTLLEVESKYENLGKSMLDTFFTAKLRPDEESAWKEIADAHKGGTAARR